MAKPQPKRHRAKKAVKKWSGEVTQESDALELQQDIFKSGDAATIAQSLKRSALRSHRRKTTPFRSAMSMLNFYINRAGSNLTAAHRKVLEDAKDELRKVFGREIKDK